MAATKYTYSISTDFTGLEASSPNTTALGAEIQTSAIVTALDYINTSGDDCDVWFKAALSSGDEDILDALIAAHTGAPSEPVPQEVTLVGDAEGGITRVAAQAAAIPANGVEFALGCSGELDASQSIETVSDIIPLGHTLKLLMARASCRPLIDANGVKNIMLVELLWKEIWDDETYYHLFGKSYLDLECAADFPASSVCFDGAPMIGDGETTQFVIRRTIIGNCNAQDTLVAIRGYTVEE
jgi:hypothetical protein